MSSTEGRSDSYSCSIDEGCQLYRVYCAVEIPPSKLQVLDDLILSSRRGLVGIDRPTPGPFNARAALIFMHSDIPGTLVKSGSHVPMRPFPSYPLAGKSLQQIYEKQRQSNEDYLEAAEGDCTKIPLAMHNFAVVDDRTLKDGTMLLCSSLPVPSEFKLETYTGCSGDNTPAPEGLATLRADGFSGLLRMVIDETGNSSIGIYDKPKWFVYTEQYKNYEREEYKAMIQAKIARGEPLTSREESTSGLRDPTK